MARVLYVDCFSGISGDMFLGACLDAGLPLADLRQALGSLGASEIAVAAEKVLRAGVSATRFIVHDRREQAFAEARSTDAPGHVHVHGHTHAHSVSHSHERPSAPNPEPGTTHSAPSTQHPAPHLHPHTFHPHRSLPEIFALVERSALSASGKSRVRELFQRLAEAEAAIHQMPVEQVHLHEVGAIDSIVDIVGAVFAMEWIGAERIVCSPLNVGSGTVQTMHGLLPVPAPATVKLLAGAPIYAGAVPQELVTPTGALIATSYSREFGPLPAMTLHAVGYGAGSRDHTGTPNVLRLLIGEAASDIPGDRVVQIECEIDDMNPQLFGSAMEQLYAAGALEVFYVPVQMKKNRPGTRLTVLGRPQDRQALIAIVFRETTTIGVRHTEVARECLRRDWVTVQTAFGSVRIKRAWHDGRLVNAVPEFDDCAARARDTEVSVKDIHAAALVAYSRSQERTNAS